MKGLILAGGRGKRMGPFARDTAKQLLPVANRPILHYAIDQMVNIGISDIGVIISPETGRQVQESLAQSTADCAVSFILQKKPQGIAHCIQIAREHLGDEPFLMFLGDNLIGGDLTTFSEMFRASEPDALILLKAVDRPDRFGVAELDHRGRIIRVSEKPCHPSSNLAILGIYAFSPSIHDVILSLVPSDRGELEITDALQILIDRGGSVRNLQHEAWWFDVGTVEDLIAANRLALRETARKDLRGQCDSATSVIGDVYLSPGTYVEDSVLRGPLVIDSGTRIISSTLGPGTSVGKECEIVGSRVVESLVFDKARIEGAWLERSLIAEDAEVVDSGPSESNARCVIHSEGSLRFR